MHRECLQVGVESAIRWCLRRRKADQAYPTMRQPAQDGRRSASYRGVGRHARATPATRQDVD